MSIYARFKKSQDGFRALVELLETTPKDRRAKMIEAGLREDPEYTERAVALMMTFEDVLKLTDGELAELTATVATATIATSICRQPKEVKERFLRSAPPRTQGELRDLLDIEAELRAIGGAQLKMIEAARKLEKQGYIQTKRIPLSPG